MAEFFAEIANFYLLDSPLPGFNVPIPEMPPWRTGVGVKMRDFQRFSAF